ncbi:MULTISPECIES: YfiR family protein [Acinetobacter]|jgi:hypothetical protein|uniref:YfiR family protein n=2 Tax=Acinetobacter TaxID=469 RepID=A0A4Q7AVQ2_9GAMM|nr:MULTISPECIES: YfiR family protein [Acinetobacter]MCW8039354.1 YfiR family protein [Acinetobacter entericus]RZG66414.1 YfiR family protein [Acinetobacter bouvetii]TCB73359.1 YfiR family protein [Acinetobacter sp. ANC 4177]
MFPRITLNTLCVCVAFFSAASFADPVSTPYSTTFSILSYAKWNTTMPEICVVDNSALAQQFQSHSPNPSNFKISSILSNAIKSKDCEVLIFSTLSPKAEQQLLNTAVSFPTLSISTNNAECELGSAFCIYKRNSSYAFKVNLNSLSQAKVHIDPRVLLLGKNMEGNQ